MIHVAIDKAKVVRTAIMGGVVGLMYIQPIRPVVVSGRSMEPTYKNGSLHLATMVEPTSLRPGDVVIVRVNGSTIIKRIALVPGDLVGQVKSGDSWVSLVDVHPLRNLKTTRVYRWSTVPPGEIYVLGDNFAVSYDSRQFGFIPIDSVEGKLLDQRPFKHPFGSQ